MILATPGSEISINTDVCSNSLPATQIAGPSIASDGSGTFIFVWEGLPSGDTDLRILGRIYEKDSTTASLNPVAPLCDETITISSFGGQAQPHCAMNGRKEFGITWIDNSVIPSRGKFSLFSNDLLTPTTADMSLPILLGSTDQSNPKMAISDTTIGLMAFAWLETSPVGVMFVRVAVYSLFDDSGPGAPVPGLTFQGVFEVTDGSLITNPTAVDPQIGVNGMTGDFFVSWASTNEPGGFDLIKCQKFNRNGLIGSTFVVSDPLVSATAPRLGMRPYSDEFVVSWLQEDVSITTGLFYNVFWRRMTMEGNSPSSVISPSPGVVQIPTVVASGQGDICSFGDGYFLISWIADDNVSIFTTEYTWKELPVPPTAASNVAILDSSGGSFAHGGLVINSDTTVLPTPPRMAANKDFVVIVNGDFNFASITARVVPITDRDFAGDFIQTFATPRVFGPAAHDSVALSLMDQIFFEDRGIPTGTIIFEPSARSTTDMNAWLGVQDLILIGGPINNLNSLEFLGTPALEDKLNKTTELVHLSFSLTGHGHLFGVNAPQLFVTNKNNPTSAFTLSRQYVPGNDTIIDYAIIAEPIGTTRKMIMIGGIRDFGTAMAAYIIDNVRKGLSLSAVTPEVLKIWTSVLNNNKAVVVRFIIPNSLNTTDPGSMLAAISPTGPIFFTDITLIPAQSIETDDQ